MSDNLWWQLYEFEFKRRTELNDNLRHTFQLSITEIGFVVYFSSTLIDKILHYKSVAIYSIWISFVLSSCAIIMCGLAYTFYKTALPNTAGDLKKYKAQLDEFDADRAEEMFSDFIQNRWAENATKNASRNRAKSALSFWSRVLLAISAVPLLVGVICYIANRTLL